VEIKFLPTSKTNSNFKYSNNCQQQ